MTPRMFGMLFSLAAVWGASFLFIRMGAAPFGPVPLMAMRVTIAAVCLLVFMLAMQRKGRVAGGPVRGFAAVRGRWPALIVVGLLNQAVPFCLFAYAELTLSAGVTSVVNATTPLWAALVAFLWLGERLGRLRGVGMLLGLIGVIVLVWPDLTHTAGRQSNALAPLAVLLATLCYGIAANYAKRHLSGVDSVAVATSSMVVAAVALLPLAWFWWPANPIPTAAWVAVLLLGVVCTAFAYGLYYALIASAGPARAVSVTFLIPVFGLLWGALFLKETITPLTIIGAGIVLAGTLLASGFIGKRPVPTNAGVAARS